MDDSLNWQDALSQVPALAIFAWTAWRMNDRITKVVERNSTLIGRLLERIGIKEDET